MIKITIIKNSHKMRSLFLSIVLLLVIVSSVSAGPVDRDKARTVATNFLKERILNNQVNWSVNDLALTEVTTLLENGNPAIYVFSNKGTGFILISAEDLITPVLGYASAGVWPEKGKAQNFYSFLNEYIAQISWVRSQTEYTDSEVTGYWHHYLSGKLMKSGMATTDVEPLMTCLWNQDDPYNEMCPEDPAGPGGHTLAGCVATAMSMIMYYYKYPVHGTGTHSYFCPGYGTLSVDYNNAYYDWDAMLDEVTNNSGQVIPAVATLQYHAGVAVNMKYGVDGSSAYSTDVAPALISHFGFATSTQYAARSSYTASGWESLVVGQLDAAKPVYYSGVDPTPTTGGGHAFIVDGYQVNGSSKLFHFNFGWSGYGNGYYTLANAGGYTSQQSIVKDAVPGTGYPYGCSSRTIIFPAGSFEDGSSPRLNYSPNLSCTYLISPSDSVNRIKLNFYSFDVDPSDSLFVYDGIDDTAPILGSFTGTGLPAEVISNGRYMFLKFVTDGSAESKGWIANYSSSFPAYCGGTDVLTEPVGTFEDGSGENRYNNGVVCRWKIQPPYATDLTIYFNNFDLYEGDELSIYSLGTSTTLLATYTGNQIPDPITSPTNAFLLMFKSDSYYQADGFDGYYTTSNVSIPELTGVNYLIISPNPAKYYTLLRLNSDNRFSSRITISDMTGKTLNTLNINFEKGKNEIRLDTGGLIPGMYIISVSSELGRVSRKLIIE
jgi:hypothetical protein